MPKKQPLYPHKTPSQIKQESAAKTGGKRVYHEIKITREFSSAVSKRDWSFDLQPKQIEEDIKQKVVFPLRYMEYGAAYFYEGKKVSFVSFYYFPEIKVGYIELFGTTISSKDPRISALEYTFKLGLVNELRKRGALYIYKEGGEGVERIYPIKDEDWMTEGYKAFYE